MESTKDYFDIWRKSQELVFGNLTEMTQKFQQGLQGLGGNVGGMQGFGGFQDMYTSWAKSVMNALQGTETADMDFVKETLSKTLTCSIAYQKLYEIWLPFFKAIQEKSVSPNSYKDLTDPAKFKEMMDRVFGFDPTAVSQMVEQATKLLETLGGYSQGFLKPWLDASGKSFKEFPNIMEGHPESVMKIFHTLFRAFDSTVGRAFHVPAVGKDREKIELLLRSLDDLSVYLAKRTEYEHTMYVTGLGAFEKAIATLADKVSKGEEFKRFDEFFDLWISVSEKAYYALFQTQEFSKMQGELLETSAHLRQHNFKLMELYLYDFPIALRSEMDALYKTVYDLKKKVKSLEKQIGEVHA
jgi:class III poly(R)-hydroxyalkanoic acid synthase PhaE subunit